MLSTFFVEIILEVWFIELHRIKTSSEDYKILSNTFENYKKFEVLPEWYISKWKYLQKEVNQNFLNNFVNQNVNFYYNHQNQNLYLSFFTIVCAIIIG